MPQISFQASNKNHSSLSPQYRPILLYLVTFPNPWSWICDAGQSLPPHNQLLIYAMSYYNVQDMQLDIGYNLN